MNNKQKIWQDLLQYHASVATNALECSKNATLQLGDILFDYAKQGIDVAVINKLLELAAASDIPNKIKQLFSGYKINVTETRSALHMNLRSPANNPAVEQVLLQMEQLITSAKKNNITDVISIGIGGSDLGPLMVCKALQHYKKNNIQIHFLSNVDGETLERLIKKLHSRNTICLINSKSFTTIETLLNAKYIKQWLGKYALSNTYAITANSNKAQEFGINSANIFEFWDWVGGRYSVWSAVGLSIAFSIGMAGFREFLSGAQQADQHFANTALEQNIPVMMALIGIWNNNFLSYRTHAVLPYLDSLEYFPAYLQQLEMESNGKASQHYATAPVLWGGVGCNGQHAYMQLLHQGTQVVPVDFIVAAKGHGNNSELQNLLVSSCLSQSRALLAGNRPSSTIILPRLTPQILGSLIALYEHKVFVQGVIWEINSFDQPGVEAGKKINKELLPILQGTEISGDLDYSTRRLINYFKKLG